MALKERGKDEEKGFPLSPEMELTPPFRGFTLIETPSVHQVSLCSCPVTEASGPATDIMLKFDVVYTLDGKT